MMLAATSATSVLAQPGTSATPAPAARLDSARMANATVGTLLASAAAGDSMAGLRTAAPALHAKVTAMQLRLNRPALRALPLSSVATGRATFGVVLKRSAVVPNAVEGAALDTLARLMEESYPELLRPVLGRDSTTQLLMPVDAFTAALRRQSMAESREKLARFERKYGPGAPSRNVLEVGLNYAAQWVPGFKPNAEGWPSRVELIAAYVPTYIVVPGPGVRANAASVVELGVRSYVWRAGWGGSVLRPGFVSFGAVVAGASDGAFRSPFRENSRFGGFVGWGGAKVAVLGGKGARVLVTRQVQVLPWVF
jgi:hypothetical protein